MKPGRKERRLGVDRRHKERVGGGRDGADRRKNGINDQTLEVMNEQKEE